MTELQNQDAVLAELRSKSIVELKAAFVDLKIQENQIAQAIELVVKLWKEKEVEEQEKLKAAEQALREVPAESEEKLVKPSRKKK